MRIKIANEQSGRSKAIIHISILLAVAFCVGAYLIGTTVLIAKDGTTFIEFARDLETSPIKAMESSYQHPGYPFLIITAHKIAEAWQDGSSMQDWIYSAQAVSLVFRLLAIVMLYFVGKKIVGQRFSFWAVLILILLPAPAEYGSDALSDWPHLFFLSAGFLLLIWAAASGKWWGFGFAGLAAGMGYLIRPECAQVVVFGALWLVLQMFWSRRTMSKYKAAFALVALLTGFLATAGPYMKLKGTVFPKKQLVQLAPNGQSSGVEVYKKGIGIYSNDMYTTGFSPSELTGALNKLVQRVGETLMWFFVPALLIGAYKYFRKRDLNEPGKFFVTVFIALNILVMVLLYCKFGYMSARHTLPLVVLTIFYIPIGLDVMASWLDEKFSKKSNTNFWFLVLVVIGIAICGPKLLRPIRIEKKSYREAAQWLAENTDEKDIIAAPDIRIGFYSGRKAFEYNDRGISKQARYAVKVSGDKNDMPSGEEMLWTEKVYPVGDKKSKVTIYRREL
ncbi:MAG: glycosyltransferase family 39 protein [Phycisphaerae bacterium]|jgi:hypothetical protein